MLNTSDEIDYENRYRYSAALHAILEYRLIPFKEYPEEAKEKCMIVLGRTTFGARLFRFVRVNLLASI